VIPSFLKETRSLAPYWVAFAALVAVSAMTDVLGSDLVLSPLGSRYDGSAGPFFTTLLGLVMGHGMVSHEYVNGHIEFTDGLPTTRGRLFAGKVAAAAFAVFGLVVASAATDAALDRLAPVPHQIPSVRPLLLQHLVIAAVLWFGVGAGMLLSWLRGLAFGVVVAMVMLGGLLSVAVPPLEDALPLPDSGFGTLTFTRGVASHPVGPPLFWFLAGSACAGLSGLLFLGGGGRLVARGSAAMSRLRVVGGVVGALALVCAGAGGAISTAEQLAVPEPVVVVDPPGPLRVLHRASNADHVAALLPGLEERLEAIAELIGAPLPAGPLDVEFLGTPRNHGGVYTGGKVRLRPDADANVLTHELAHAVAFERLGEAGWYQKSHTRFFNEGLANWVADELAGDGEDPASAGFVRALGQARFDLLVEDGRLIYEQDIQEAYWLGEVFVRALVDVAGRPAIGCVLDRLGDYGRRRTAGLAMWYDTASHCAFDLDRVTERWRERLDARAADLPPLPRLRVQPSVRAGVGPVLEVRDDAGSGFELVCRFRSDPSQPVDYYRHTPVADGVCRVPTGTLSGPTYDYQVGFAWHRGEAGPSGAYEPWVIGVRRNP